jgi:ABC-type phosphate transport system permease subunit
MIHFFVVVALILAWILVVIINGILVAMKVHANTTLPENQKLSFWPRSDNAKAIRTYREHYPESNLPDILSTLQYGAVALLVVCLVASIYFRNR